MEMPLRAAQAERLLREPQGAVMVMALAARAEGFPQERQEARVVLPQATRAVTAAPRSQVAAWAALGRRPLVYRRLYSEGVLRHW